MATETEAKLRVDSHEPVRARLAELGATHLGTVIETNAILDRRDGSLRRGGRGLRVRSARSTTDGTTVTTVTFKGPVEPGEFKRREEVEVTAVDADEMLRVFEALDFRVILRFQKRRESWELGGCRVELDEPPHVGLFVEIEGPDEPAIHKVRDRLGLAGVPHEKASYVRMLLAYCREHAVAEPVLTLP